MRVSPEVRGDVIGPCLTQLVLDLTAIPRCLSVKFTQPCFNYGLEQSERVLVPQRRCTTDYARRRRGLLVAEAG